jgi:hypothetical protein
LDIRNKVIGVPYGWEAYETVFLEITAAGSRIFPISSITMSSRSGRTRALLASAETARTISYLADRKWDSKNLLYGQNGIAALTFFEVP